MSNDDPGSPDATPYGDDPHETVDNPPESELAPLEAEEEPMMDRGSVGEATHVSGRLGGTGLDLIARRVLARRGIDPAAMERGASRGSAGAPAALAPLDDILSASVPVAGAPGRGTRAIVGRPAARSVILDDDGDSRERVFDTDHFPYSAIAALEITAHNGARYLGTAWFVSPFTLITAGHCVFVHNAGSADGWVRSIRVVPGRNGSGPGSEPFGAVVSTRFRTVTGWAKDGSPESDYGAILLDPGAAVNGNRVGMFGIAAYGDSVLRGFDLNVAGYPGDKKGTEAQTLWFDVKKTAKVTRRQVFYNADTYGGQSGAPVYVAQGEQRVAVAVHAYGTSAGVSSNSGTRITADVFKRIQSWKT